MGLDTFAVNSIGGPLNDEQKQAFEDACINLCGGMFSGNGNNGSFRGKVYANLVEATTGTSLYNERIEPETVENMHHNILLAIDDLYELEKFFGVCVEHELGLQGWW